MLLPDARLLAVGHASPIRVARAFSILCTVAVAIWLGYAFGRGQSLAEVARLYTDVAQLQYTVDSGETVAHYARTGGALKPLLQSHDGVSLMDYSDWDYQSTVVVDGQRFEFVRLNPSDSVDYARNRIVSGLSSGQWVLSRDISVNGSQATIAFTFLANKPVHDVRVTIAHSNWYYLEVRPTSEGFTATLPRASRGEIEAGLVTRPSYEVTLTATPASQGLPDMVRIGLATPFGIQSVATQYALRDPPVGEYVPLGREVVSWRRL